MASKIKGITIEIGGNTTKLESSLKDVNKAVYSANNELKELNKALKLDPKNTELLAQKQDVLKKSISATTDKLNQLKEAQRQMGNYNKLTDSQKENYRALTVEISKSENALKSLNKELKTTGNIDLSKLKTTLKSVGNVALEVTKKVAQVVSAVGAAVGAVVTAGVKSYAELEQNIGGVETLFGKDADKVKENAAKAFETAGVSANEYMEGVTSFSASLLQSLGNDTSKAADVADMAFRDMADNANKFGTDMSSIQSAYQGFAKQNYTMLDNLKLGYGGTKTEMERLLADAEKLTGVHYDISNLSDVYSAIHVIQDELHITGTTADEATKTIGGSITSMKAAFDNFLNGSGSAKDLSKAIMNVVNNVSKVVKKLAPEILKGLVNLINDLLPQLIELLMDMLPELINTAMEILEKLMDAISNNVEPIVQMVTTLLMNIVNFILKNLPMILKTGMQLLAELVKGIAEALPELIPAMIDAIILMVETLIDNIDLLVDAAGKLIIGLAEGLIKSIPLLIAKAPEIIKKLIKAFLNLIPQLFDLGGQLLSGILDGLMNIGSKIKDAVKNVGTKIKDGFKSFFGIHSPSRLMSDQVGMYIGEGVTEGIINGIDETESKVNKAMRQLASGIETSVNPTINPTANTNPLIIQIENFNNYRESDIQQLSQELEFYRKNSALARGGN